MVSKGKKNKIKQLSFFSLKFWLDYNWGWDCGFTEHDKQRRVTARVSCK